MLNEIVSYAVFGVGVLKITNLAYFFKKKIFTNILSTNISYVYKRQS